MSIFLQPSTSRRPQSFGPKTLSPLIIWPKVLLGFNLSVTLPFNGFLCSKLPFQRNSIKSHYGTGRGKNYSRNRWVDQTRNSLTRNDFQFCMNKQVNEESHSLSELLRRKCFNVISIMVKHNQNLKTLDFLRPNKSRLHILLVRKDSCIHWQLF